MNDLTIHSETPFQTSSTAEMTMELAKMLALVAPITMTAAQQEVWLRAAIDSLKDIRPREVMAVSQQVRRTVTRQSQIVPLIADLVEQERSRERRIRQMAPANEELRALPPTKRDVMDRRGEPMSEEDTAKLNARLEGLGATKRYRPDGSKYDVRRK